MAFKVPKRAFFDENGGHFEKNAKIEKLKNNRLWKSAIECLRKISERFDSKL